MERPTKETLTIEFKSDKKPLPNEDLYDAIVAMVNTDGGMLYLGIEDNGIVTGVHPQHKNIVELEAKIQTHTVPPVAVQIQIVNYDGMDVAAINVPMGHQLTMTSTGKYMRRRMKQDNTPEAIPLQPMEIMQRLSYIQAIDPSAQVIEDVPADKVLSPLEHERLREMVRVHHGESALLELDNLELDKALGFVKERKGVYYPTIAGLLVLGYEQAILEYVPSNEVLFQVLDGTDVLVNLPAMHGPLLQVFEKVELMFQSRITEQEVMVGMFRVPVPNFEKDAFREGFINALVHRDYFRSGAVQVQLQMQNNSMYIVSAGGFPEGVNADNILTAAPTARNSTLADAVKRIGLAERTGRGVDKIYLAMLRDGHEIPDYSKSNTAQVRLDLRSAKLDEAYIKMIVEEESKLSKPLPIDALIALSCLRSERRLTVENFARRIQQPEINARETLEGLVELGMVEAVGNGVARHYMLSAKVYALTNNETGYTRQRGFTVIQECEMILAHLSHFSKISRGETAELCKCNDNHAYFLLRKLADEGRIERIGNGRYAIYHLIK